MLYYWLSVDNKIKADKYCIHRLIKHSMYTLIHSWFEYLRIYKHYILSDKWLKYLIEYLIITISIKNI